MIRPDGPRPVQRRRPEMVRQPLTGRCSKPVRSGALISPALPGSHHPIAHIVPCADCGGIVGTLQQRGLRLFCNSPLLQQHLNSLRESDVQLT